MAFHDWSSLPFEFIDRIADFFLATNDVDYYMDFRAVCSSRCSATQGRSYIETLLSSSATAATGDPKNSSDIRFQPRRWVIIDEVFQSDARLLVNTATGRAVRKDLPLLRNYNVIAITHGGLFILVARNSPTRTACFLNPFTGHMIRFMAPVPSEMDVTADVSGSSPTLSVFTVRRTSISMADPHSESFVVLKDNVTYHMIRVAVEGAFYNEGEQGSMVPLSFPMEKFMDLMKQYDVVDPSVVFPDNYNEPIASEFYNFPRHVSHCFLVRSAGEVLIILKMQHHVEIFKMDTDRDMVEPIKSIGNNAIFVSYRRCLSVRADKFPSINADCIYYAKYSSSSVEIYMYDLNDKKEERISEAMNSLNPFTLSFADPPFTIIQLLSSCTINARKSRLSCEKLFKVRFPAGSSPYDDVFSSDFDFDANEFYD